MNSKKHIPQRDIDLACGMDIRNVWGRLHLPPLPPHGNVCSPFRPDKHPTCEVGGTKNIFHDYGTGETLDTIELVRKARDCGFHEAISFISNRPLYSCKTSGKAISRPVVASEHDPPPPPPKLWPTLDVAEEAFTGLTPVKDDETARKLFSDEYGLAPDTLPDSWRVFSHPQLGDGVVYRGEDSDGSPVFKFKSIHRNGNGKRESRFLYGSGGMLRFLHPGAVLVVVGGEEKALAAFLAGFSALSLLTGEKALGEEIIRSIVGLDPPQIVLANDADETGNKANMKTAAALERAGFPPDRIAIVQWPKDAPRGFDLNDVAAGGLGELRALIENSAPWKELKRLTNKIHTESDMKLIPTYHPFPLHLMPPEIGAWIGKRAQAIPCDPAMIALPVLSMLAAAIGATRRIQLKGSWTEPAVLWTAIIAPSGSAKSPAIDAALSPIQAIEKQACHDYEREFATWVEEREEYRNTPKEERDEVPPVAPTVKRFLISDITVEALAPLLLENPRGLLVMCDELASWIGSMGQYNGGKGADQSKWLEMHGARSLRVDRKNAEPRFMFVPYAAVSVTGGIQPGILRTVIGDHERENGFLARFLLAYPPLMAKRWTDEDADEQSENRIKEIIEWLLELDFKPDVKGVAQPVDVKLTHEAKELFSAFVNEMGQTNDDTSDELMKAALSKLEGAAARLALILHLTDLSEQGYSMDAPVSCSAMERGIKLAKWFVGETERVYKILSESSLDKEMRQAVAAVIKLGDAVTPRDLSRKCGLFRNKGGMEHAEAVLNRLVEAGWAIGVNEIMGLTAGGRYVNSCCIAKMCDRTLKSSKKNQVLSPTAVMNVRKT